MFTGIVEEVGSVAAIRDGGLTIAATKVTDDLEVSDSICVNGACLTVTQLDGGRFSVDVVPETLRRTNLGALGVGYPVNLERPLALSDRLGGHIVQGHVDGTADVSAIEDDGDALMITFRAPPNIMRYVVEKGFVAVDGTSLTVVNCALETFSVTIIPYTLANTVFGSRRVGDSVNVETDIVAKYVERLASAPLAPADILDEL